MTEYISSHHENFNDVKIRIEKNDNTNFLKTIDSGSIQLIVTSPPYNIGKSYEAKRPLETYIEDMSTVISETVRVLSEEGSICWQVGNYVHKGEVFPLDIEFYKIFKGHGLKLRNRIIWQFNHGLHCKKRLSGRYETILWFTKGDNYVFNLDPIRIPSKYPNKKHFKGPKKGQLSGNPLGKNPSDVWQIPNVKHNHVEKTIHPCQFPVELIERLVLSLTNKGDCVLDPYMGVGSSMIASIMHGRSAYGCDILEEYVNIANQRIDKLIKGELKTRPMNTPIYIP